MYSIIKRIHKEIDDNAIQPHEFKPTIVQYDYNNQSIRVSVNRKEFVITPTYPFKQPSVYINQRPYMYYLKPPTKRIYRALNKLKYDCPCCNTIVNNWSPVYTMSKILDEIDNTSCIKRNVKYYIALEELAKKYPIIEQLAHAIREYL